MTRYSFAQLEGLWIQAGGSHALAPVMAAIALAESGGDPAANNYTDNGGTQTSWGLWQISNGTHSMPDPNINNPLVNAKAAVAKYNDQGLSAWGTYDSGAYKQYLGSAKPATLTAAEIAGGGSGGDGGGSKSGSSDQGLLGWVTRIAGDINPFSDTEKVSQAVVGDVTGKGGGLSGISDVAQGIVGLTLPFVKVAQAIDWFFVPSHWVRILAGVGGGVLVVAGLVNLSGVTSDVLSSLPGGSVAKPMTLPVGIAEVGFGSVLLFVAFHNISPNIKTFGQFLADLQGKAQAGFAADTSPAAAVQTAQAAEGS